VTTMLNDRRLPMWAAAALVSCTAAVASAQTPADHRSYFTFTGTVEVPGATLPAGKYMFRLPSPDTSHSVVQVVSADGKKVYSTFFTMSAQRPEAVGDPEIRFMETPAGAPRAIRTWWFAGDRTGGEFVYPKAQAQRLAKATSQPVLTTTAAAAKPENTRTEDLARVSPTGEEAKVSANTESAPTGSAFQGQVAASSVEPFTPANQNSTSAGQSNSNRDRAAGQGARTSLPRTASTAPLVGLFGFVALLGAAILWGWRNRGEGSM